MLVVNPAELPEVLTVNHRVDGGVVFNEMKGAYSSPAALLGKVPASAIAGMDTSRAIRPAISTISAVVMMPQSGTPRYVIDIMFRAGDQSLNRTADFLYSLFVPARAQLAFPCFDQPDLKARYALERRAWKQPCGSLSRQQSPASSRRTAS